MNKDLRGFFTKLDRKKDLKMSLQECLASRKDCSGGGRPLSQSQVLEILISAHQPSPSKRLFVVLPDGPDYKGGVYKYHDNELTLISDKEKTNYTMEVYPELIWQEKIPLEELLRVGLTWQYLSLKAENIGLGVSQRARKPKNFNKIVNQSTGENHVFLYSVAVRERDRNVLMEDDLEPPREDIGERTFLLDTPDCYKNRAIYEKKFKGISLDLAINNKIEKKRPNTSTLHEISQLLWACQGETDHATHGNRDVLEKNGYGRVHATGCAGYSVYPIVILDELANLPKGNYVYNPVGFSALNRWIRVEDNVYYDHFIQQYSSDNHKSEIEKEFECNFTNFAILCCIDKKKPCSGRFHSKIVDTTYWSEIEAGMALAGLQLQANALGLKWKKIALSNPYDLKYRNLFNLDLAEKIMNTLASKLLNPAKNEKISLLGKLVPTVLFYFSNN